MAKKQSDQEKQEDALSSHGRDILELEAALVEYREAYQEADTLNRWEGVSQDTRAYATARVDVARTRFIVAVRKILG